MTAPRRPLELLNLRLSPVAMAVLEMCELTEFGEYAENKPPKCSACANPRPDCMGAIVPGIGNRCAALGRCVWVDS